MDMKRYNYIIILLLAALCFGCSDTVEEMRDAGAIRFSASHEWPDESPSTRIASGDPFKEGDQIGVFACYRTPDETSANTVFAPNYMRNQLVKFDGTAWAYSPLKYWPANGSVYFFGYFPYDASHEEVDDGFVHECKTGFERLYQASSLVKADNGTLSGGISDNGNLKLGFFPILNRVNFTAKAKDDLFEHGGKYVDCHFLIKEFRVWGFYQNATYSMTQKKWTTKSERYTKKNPLDMTDAILKVNMEGSEEVPDYKYDPDKGYCTESALVITKKQGVEGTAKEIFGKSAHFIPLNDAVADNEPAFEVVYVVLTKPVDKNEYKESGIVTRSGSLKDIFNGTGLIEKNININLFFGIDGVTVTRTLEDYTYKPMF